MKRTFSRYEVFLISVLTFLQFTITVDFMVLSPLSAILLPELKITTTQFGLIVSAYAWSAGISGLLAAGFADRYDRKKLLLLFYCGFIFGTFLCGIAADYVFLLVARIITGIFGGVIGSITYAIVTDLFSLQVRGRVMGFLQMGFAGAVVLGLPIGLYVANVAGWRSPFLVIAGLCAVVLVLLIRFLKPVDAHLKSASEHKPVDHLIQTVANPHYIKAFGAALLVAIAGFMLMPFGSAFAVYNNGISLDALPLLYLVSGVSGMFAAPLVGRLSDALGKYIVFCICSAIMMISVVIYGHLGLTPLWIVIVFSVMMFTSYLGRMVSSSALLTGVPDASDRGAFMSVNSSLNMFSGGIASLIAGSIVHQAGTGQIINYDILGYVVAGASLITIGLMYTIDRIVKQKQAIVGVVHQR
jgi:predicted MFS family arabinose efflux permease